MDTTHYEIEGVVYSYRLVESNLLRIAVATNECWP